MNDRAAPTTPTAGRAALGLRHALIVAEIGLSAVLLVGAGLLVRSFANLQNVQLGFDPADVLTMRLTLPAEKYRGAAINDFFQRIVDRLEETAAAEIPGLGRRELVDPRARDRVRRAVEPAAEARVFPHARTR